MSRRATASALVVAAAIIGAVLLWSLRVARVEVYRVGRRDLVPVVAGRGEILPPVRVDVRPSVIGKVLRIAVAEGQPVSAGDLLAELDGTPYAAQAALAETAVADGARAAGAAEVSVDSAARKLDRASALSRKRIASRDFLAAARIDLAKAREAHVRASEALAAARSRLAAAREAMARTRITAPVPGRVVALRARPAETVSESTPIAVIEERETLRALVRIRADEGKFVAAGESASVTSPGAGAAYSGQVLPDSPPNKSVDSAYLSVMIAIPATSPLSPGTAILARIESPPLRSVLVVPVTALRRRGASRSAEVFVAEAGRARRRAVVVGARGDREAQILSGVVRGEAVVGGPAPVLSRLEEGARIVPVERKEE